MEGSATRSSMQVMTGALVGKLMNLLALLLITPVLGPEGFGYLLLIGVVQGFFNLFLDIGFEHYYILNVRLAGPDKSTPEQIALVESIVFQLRLLSNIILFVLQLVVSVVGVGLWFDAPIDLCLQILSLVYLINIFGKINEVRLKKRMQFSAISAWKIISDMAGAVLKVALVLAGFGVAGWCAGVVMATAVYAFGIVRAGNYKPKIMRISAEWRKSILWFAKHSWFSGLVLYLQSNLSNILVKTFFTNSQAGLIQFSSSYTTEIFNGVFASQMSVLVPFYNNNQHDPRRIRSAINQMVELSYLVFGLPMVVGIVFGQELIDVLFGAKWHGAYPIFLCYCFYVLIRMLYAPALVVHSSLGKMKLGTYMAVSGFMFSGLALWLVSIYTKSIFWFSFTFVATTIVAEMVKAFLGLRFLGIYPQHLAADSKGALISVAATALFAGLLHHYWSVETVVLISLQIVLTAIFFIAAQWLFNRKVFYLLKEKYATASGMAGWLINKVLPGKP